MSRGMLVWVIGPSGAGKDSLMLWLVSSVGIGAPMTIARRTITRGPDVGDEGHLAVDPATFLTYQTEGAFTLTWSAHGCLYGVPTSIHSDVAAGRVVLVAGSRGATDRWLARHPDSEVVLVRCAPETLRERLTRRNRLDGTSVAERLHRMEVAAVEPRPGWIVVDNDRGLDEVGERLRQALAERLAKRNGRYSATVEGP